MTEKDSMGTLVSNALMVITFLIAFSVIVQVISGQSLSGFMSMAMVTLQGFANKMASGVGELIGARI